MDDAATRTVWIVGGIIGSLVLGLLGFVIVYRLRGPLASRIIATHVVGLSEPFDWTVHAATDGRHALWIQLGLEFEGEDADGAAFRLRMQIDDAPTRDYLFNCDAKPGDAGMGGQWMSRLHISGGQGTLGCVVWACGFRPRPAGTPIRVRGILGEPSVKSGGFELRFSRK